MVIRMTGRSRPRRALLTLPLAGMVILVAGCSTSLPDQATAFAASERYINAIRFGQNLPPIVTFNYRESSCSESDDSHGSLGLSYTMPDKASPAQILSQANQMARVMEQVGLGDATVSGDPYDDDDVSVDATDGTYQVFVDYSPNNSLMSYNAGTCYSTPGPTDFPYLSKTTSVPQPSQTSGSQ